MSDGRKAQFDERGFIVLEGLFSHQEVAELKAEKEKVLEAVKQQKGEDSVKHGVYVGMTIASPMFKRAAAKPTLVAALKEVIGEQVVFLSDKVVFKDSKVDYGSPWHQDYPYWKGSHKYSVWIALDDAFQENGCLRVVPGSHKLGAVQHGGETDGNGFDNRLTADSIDPAQVVDLPAERGTAIIFHDLLFHSSYPNKSGADRVALISTYKDGTQEDPDYPWAKAAFALQRYN
jgi:phytanoyl-CoA hydroxylase